MIVITDVECFETDGTEARVIPKRQFRNRQIISGDGSTPPNSLTVISEIVKGVEIVNPRTGREVIVGWSSDVDDKIGLPLSLMRNICDDLDMYKRRIETLERQLEYYRERCSQLETELLWSTTNSEESDND